MYQLHAEHRTRRLPYDAVSMPAYCLLQHATSNYHQARGVPTSFPTNAFAYVSRRHAQPRIDAPSLQQVFNGLLRFVHFFFTRPIELPGWPGFHAWDDMDQPQCGSCLSSESGHPVDQ